LESQWIYYRYERQFQDAIHSHGVCRLKNDHRIAALTSLIFNGKLKQQLLPLIAADISKYDQFVEIIKKGKRAEYRITSYVDTLIGGMNFKALPLNPEVCRVDGYCNRKKDSSFNQCLFGYPFDMCQETKTVFAESSKNINPKLVLARNDPCMNRHC